MKRCRRLEEIVGEVKSEFPKATISVDRKKATISIYIDMITSISIYIEWWDSLRVTFNRFNLDSWCMMRDTFVVNEIFMIKPLLPDDIKEKL